ncbi:hypothetical protein GCM10027040_08920 [Halomonas shantousis]
MLHRIGAILAVLASLFAIFTAGTALYMSGVAGGVEQDAARETVTGVGLGWLELLVAILALILGVAAFFALRPGVGLALTIVGVIGALLSSTSNIAFMLTVAVGGFMAYMGRRRARKHGVEDP